MNYQFSPNGDLVYFEAADAATSAALYTMKIDGSSLKRLGAGNDTRIILTTGNGNDEHAGWIVVQQHRYWHFGGSYDWYWLYSPEWNEIAPLSYH